MSSIQYPSTSPGFISKRHNDIYQSISPLSGLSRAAAGLSVVVTGAGRGIGRSIALAFAQAGARQVAITSRTQAELDEVESLIKADTNVKDTSVVKLVQDVLDEEGFAKAFAVVGEVDVLINNAGILEAFKPIGDAELATWFRTLEVNLKGTFIPTQAVLKQTVAAGRTKPVTIINTSSGASANTSPGASAYQASKSAVNRFTEHLHYEYPDTVRAFSYHPGGVLTKLGSGLPTDLHHLLTDTPELAAGYSLWLTTPAADFLRGKYSSCNWDVDELMSKKEMILEKNLLWTVVAGVEQVRK
ncbi:NAD-P-binding protein [Meredithblackwellia eburnea MCA 4105]